MQRKEAISVGDFLAEYFRETGLEKPLMERQVVASWDSLMGEMVSRLTRKVELKDGILRVWLNSAALKAQLFECRHELVHKLNNHVGCEVVKEVRLLG